MLEIYVLLTLIAAPPHRRQQSPEHQVRASLQRAGKTRTPAWDSSGESRLNRQNVLQRLNQQTGIVSDAPVLLNVEEQPRSPRGVHPAGLGRTVRETPLRVRGAA